MGTVTIHQQYYDEELGRHVKTEETYEVEGGRVVKSKRVVMDAETGEVLRVEEDYGDVVAVEDNVEGKSYVETKGEREAKSFEPSGGKGHKVVEVVDSSGRVHGYRDLTTGQSVPEKPENAEVVGVEYEDIQGNARVTVYAPRKGGIPAVVSRSLEEYLEGLGAKREEAERVAGKIYSQHVINVASRAKEVVKTVMPVVERAESVADKVYSALAEPVYKAWIEPQEKGVMRLEEYYLRAYSYLPEPQRSFQARWMTKELRTFVAMERGAVDTAAWTVALGASALSFQPSLPSRSISKFWSSGEDALGELLGGAVAFEGLARGVSALGKVGQVVGEVKKALPWTLEGKYVRAWRGVKEAKEEAGHLLLQADKMEQELLRLKGLGLEPANPDKVAREIENLRNRALSLLAEAERKEKVAVDLHAQFVEKRGPSWMDRVQVNYALPGSSVEKTLQKVRPPAPTSGWKGPGVRRFSRPPTPQEFSSAVGGLGVSGVKNVLTLLPRSSSRPGARTTSSPLPWEGPAEVVIPRTGLKPFAGPQVKPAVSPIVRGGEGVRSGERERERTGPLVRPWAGTRGATRVKVPSPSPPSFPEVTLSPPPPPLFKPKKPAPTVRLVPSGRGGKRALEKMFGRWRARKISHPIPSLAPAGNPFPWLKKKKRVRKRKGGYKKRSRKRAG